MQEIKEDLRKISSDIGDIKIDIGAIKVDVNHHIKRSDASERRLERLEQVFMWLGSVGVLGGVVALFWKFLT